MIVLKMLIFKFKKVVNINYLISLFFVMFLVGCSDSSEQTMRTYKEIDINPPTTQTIPSLSNENSHDNLDWITPSGWIEKGGNNMRLATFSNDSDSIETTIVRFGGQGGSERENILRWLKQLELNDLSDTQITDFISAAPKVKNTSGFSGKIYDFSLLQPEKADANTFISSIMIIKGQTVFVKMSGSIEAVQQDRPKYLELISSLK